MSGCRECDHLSAALSTAACDPWITSPGAWYCYHTRLTAGPHMFGLIRPYGYPMWCPKRNYDTGKESAGGGEMSMTHAEMEQAILKNAERALDLSGMIGDIMDIIGQHTEIMKSGSVATSCLQKALAAHQAKEKK